MTVEEWVEAYGRAWREKDADAVVGLFTEDAEYR
jgi:ketosteroid isomerase-like protein